MNSNFLSFFSLLAFVNVVSFVLKKREKFFSPILKTCYIFSVIRVRFHRSISLLCTCCKYLIERV